MDLPNETAQVLKLIPTSTWDDSLREDSNAFVFKCNGEIVILPDEGGALVFKISDAIGDLAPYCD